MAPTRRSLCLLLLYIISFLVGLPANLMALRAFVGRVRQPQPSPIHILLLNLTLADLLLLLLLPFKMAEAAEDFHWYLPHVMCVITAYGFYSSIYCSTWLLAGISIERYRSVAFPVRYKLTRRPVYGVIAALIAWVMSFGHCSIVIIVLYLPNENTTSVGGVCYGDFSQRQLALLLPVRLELCLVLFFIPMGITIFCYWRLVWIMLSRAHVGAQKRWRAVALAALNLFNFLVCFGPYNVSHVLGYIHQENEEWRVCAVFLGALNACVDPLIFYFSSSAVRNAVSQRHRLLQSWGTWLAGRWRRGGREQAAKTEDGMGMADVSLAKD
ncbi:PREDICTED: free fatty acid receptor 2-like [Condylura cristata]|uniref:free fatty acid receptor 2-like n=1 Tax=Condylura cristata TaxID=143302 RepID=UPI000643E609|nr:PREDICTED: free fatty acid receptor 2-like [Condylura cristata]